MEITKRKCQQCETETEDRYEHLGWITIKSGRGITSKVAFSISKGRDYGRIVQTLFEEYKHLDFCCIGCLVTFFQEKAIMAKKEKETKSHNLFTDQAQHAVDELENELYLLGCRVQALERKINN